MQNYLKLSFICLIAFLYLNSCDSSGGDNGTGSGQGYSHVESVGASSNDLLSGDSYDRLVIEIDYVEGYQPTQQALDNLKSFLESRLNKPSGITLNLDDALPATRDTSLTIEEVYDMEQEYRDTYTNGSTMAAYFIITDGKYEHEQVLGVAYFNTSMVIFEEVIQNYSGGFNQPSTSTMETTSLRHEFGHILGLVDNGTPALQDHVDEENGAHCTNENCLMYYAVENRGFVSNLGGGEVPELDQQCISDLQANGGK